VGTVVGMATMVMVVMVAMVAMVALKTLNFNECVTLFRNQAC
jgi:hypothetical protein